MTAWISCESDLVLNNLGSGVHRLEARAVDDAGDVDPSPASFSWLIHPTTLEVTQCPSQLYSNESSSIVVVLTTPISFSNDEPCTNPTSTIPCMVQYKFVSNMQEENDMKKDDDHDKINDNNSSTFSNDTISHSQNTSYPSSLPSAAPSALPTMSPSQIFEDTIFETTNAYFSARLTHSWENHSIIS
eukprot:CAMPEP_0114339232 /NCGR_PEP_ID=MMETSP0101-20121206/7591_1 /TAXON_ID=38822 ORGANISM="Pteridomonas danica, Strain PT" /NCGR_SAMPLE_ID=MMETSP0101 /ASSEMBLY_ACC=CAM_ASM_000211 /LENGTH=186 /DNA_ID=CAMNT_0001472129 /DNA_START=213 /DNA_END=776 /DNA_ORIENTATION=-